MSKIKISDLTIDPKVSIRKELDNETVERYAESLGHLLPVLVFKVDGKMVLVDGFHRVQAAKKLRWEEIDAEIRHGSRDEALEQAVSANVKHGKPLTREEQKAAVRRLKGLHPDWGCRLLGEAVGRSQNFAETVLKSDEVRGALINAGVNTGLEDSKLEQVYSAPRELWPAFAQQAEKGRWTVPHIAEAVRRAKNGTEAVEEAPASGNGDDSTPVAEEESQEGGDGSNTPGNGGGTPEVKEVDPNKAVEQISKLAGDWMSSVEALNLGNLGESEELLVETLGSLSAYCLEILQKLSREEKPELPSLGGLAVGAYSTN